MNLSGSTYINALNAFISHPTCTSCCLGLAGKDQNGKTLYKTVNKLTALFNNFLHMLSRKWGYNNLSILDSILLDYRSSSPGPMAENFKDNLNSFTFRMKLPRLQFTNYRIDGVIDKPWANIHPPLPRHVTTQISYKKENSG